MSKFLRLFEFHDEYEEYSASTSFTIPNVSRCIVEDHVHYNERSECTPGDNYMLLSAPSYPRYIEGDEETFEMTFKYMKYSTDANCVNTMISSGDTAITINCGCNPDVHNQRTINGSANWNDIDIPYSLTQGHGYQCNASFKAGPNTPGFAGFGLFKSSSNNIVSITVDGTPLDIPSSTSDGTIWLSPAVPGKVYDVDVVFNTRKIKNWLSDRHAFTSAVFGDGFISVEYYAFHERGIRNFTQVTLPDTIESIGRYAFASFGGTDLVLPSNLTKIGDHAFYGSNITGITMPNNTIEIGEYAFWQCTGLTYADLGGTVNIPNDCFMGCTSLTSVTMPYVENIGEESFGECGLIEVALPSAKIIGPYAFRTCNSLTSVTIGQNVEFIARYAFNNPSTTDVTCTASEPPILGVTPRGGSGIQGNVAFASTAILKVPSDKVDDYKWTWYYFKDQIQALP